MGLQALVIAMLTVIGGDTLFNHSSAKLHLREVDEVSRGSRASVPKTGCTSPSSVTERMKVSGRRICAWRMVWIGLPAALLLFLLTPRTMAEDPSRGQQQFLDSGAPSSEDLNRAISLAAAYLEHACGPDGKFVYRVNVNSGLRSNSYNIVRHAGAMYALAMLNRSYPNKDVVDALVRAASFLRTNYIGPGVRSDQFVVWASPTARSSTADLGATGLALVALVAVEQARPDTVPLGELQGLGHFLLFLQRPDGSFVNKYRMEGGPVEDFESLYYPGEASLGLLCLYELDHSTIWLNAAARALSYLARSRVGLADVPPDHWALIATEKFLPYYGLSSSPASQQGLIYHAEQICRSLIKDQVRNPVAAAFGAFNSTGQTAPTATRMEGLLAALEFLPDKELRTQIENSVNQGIAFLLRAQFLDGQYTGGMPQAVAPLTPGSYEIRVDYVQHALCAWLRYSLVHRGMGP